MYVDSGHVGGLRILADCPYFQAKLCSKKQNINKNRQRDRHQNHRAEIPVRGGDINQLVLCGHGMVSGYAQMDQPERHHSGGKKIDSHAGDKLYAFQISAHSPEN